MMPQKWSWDPKKYDGGALQGSGTPQQWSWDLKKYDGRAL